MTEKHETMLEEKKKASPSLHIHWPAWARIYAFVVALPLIFVLAVLAIWIFPSRFGGLLEDYQPTGVTLLSMAFAISFLSGAYLFFAAFRRIINHQPESLAIASTGHLVITAPAVAILVVEYLRNSVVFLSEMADLFESGSLTWHWLLIAWLLLNIYASLFLALSDNTPGMFDDIQEHEG